MRDSLSLIYRRELPWVLDDEMVSYDEMLQVSLMIWYGEMLKVSCRRSECVSGSASKTGMKGLVCYWMGEGHSDSGDRV